MELLKDITGLNNGITPLGTAWYNWHSGLGGLIIPPILTGLVVVGGYYLHHMCIERGCFRIGHIDPEHHHPACKKHHSKSHLIGGES